MTPGSRFWNQWREPASQRPPVPTFKLVFPGWALSFNEEDRKKGRPKKWDTNDILIEGDDKLLTVVSFFIMDEGREPWQQGLPSKPIGILPLRQGKDLCVVAHREYEGNLHSMVVEGLKRVFAKPNFQSGVVEDFKRAFPNGLPPGAAYDEVFEVCLTEEEPPGYA